MNTEKLYKYRYWITGGILLLGLGVYFALSNRKKPIGSKSKRGIKALDWSNDKDFFVNAEGKNLYQLGSKAGVKMSRNMGLNGAFNEKKYKENKNNSAVYWAVYDITNDKLLASSEQGKKNIYGASVPKVCVSASAFANKNGVLPNDADYQKVIKLLVLSDNNVWNDVQALAGGGDSVNNWASRMGYTMKPARGGGNNANAVDMCRFWNDVCRNNFKGAENIFKITSSCRTDSNRGRKCMPKNVYMGGKTGTYDKSNHDTCWIKDGDNFYSISVLTELGGNGSEVIAQMFRGLYNEYVKNGRI